MVFTFFTISLVASLSSSLFGSSSAPPSLLLLLPPMLAWLGAQPNTHSRSHRDFYLTFIRPPHAGTGANESIRSWMAFENRTPRLSDFFLHSPILFISFRFLYPFPAFRLSEVWLSLPAPPRKRLSSPMLAATMSFGWMGEQEKCMSQSRGEILYVRPHVVWPPDAIPFGAIFRVVEELCVFAL